LESHSNLKNAGLTKSKLPDQNEATQSGNPSNSHSTDTQFKINYNIPGTGCRKPHWSKLDLLLNFSLNTKAK
jgi:hypothetical protein